MSEKKKRPSKVSPAQPAIHTKLSELDARFATAMAELGKLQLQKDILAHNEIQIKQRARDIKAEYDKAKSSV